MVAGKLSGDGDMREGALRNKTLYNFIFPLSTVGWSGSGMGVGRGRPKLLRWGEGGRCAIKLCTILFFRARRHDKAGGVLRRSPLKRPRRAMPRTARSAVLGCEWRNRQLSRTADDPANYSKQKSMRLEGTSQTSQNANANGVTNQALCVTSTA